MDILFVNNKPFLLSMSRRLKFMAIEALPNRQIKTIKEKISKICMLYQGRGFAVDSIYANSEFEPLRPDFPFINTSNADNHQPDIEQAIRTVKDRVRSTYCMLPFKYIPRLMVVHLVRNTIFWLNAFPTNNGWSSKHSPRYIMTGKQLDYNKHVRAEFGEYVQTPEEHDSDMYDQTVGAICLGPTGNQQCGHYFMSLATGECLIRSQWTLLPLPRKAQTRVNYFGCKQKMPKSLTFGDRHGQEIPDNLDEAREWSDDDDDTYKFQDDMDNDDLSYDDTDDEDDDTGVDIPHNGPSITETDHANTPSTQPLTSDDLDNHENTGVEDNVPMIDTITSTGMVEDNQGLDMASQTTGVEQGQDRDDDSNTTSDYDSTEEAEYEKAEQLGIESAHNDDVPLPKRTWKKKADEIYEYYNALFAGINVGHVFLSYDDEHTNQVFNFLTDQMSAKAVLKEFGEKGAASIMQELEQLLYRKVIVGQKASSLTSSQQKAALQYLIFLKEKHCGKVKAWGCANGHKQCLYKTKDETSSPTMNVEALFITCLIDAMEGREVMTCDIPGAFMRSEMDELIHMKLEGEIALLLIRLDPSYKQFLTYQHGKPVTYTELNKALYGTLQAALLFWWNLSVFLIEKLGFEANPYNFCVVNKTINSSQCTISWHVDDLKISYVDGNVNREILTILQQEYRKEALIPSTTGKVHDYLGMTIDYSTPGKVVFCMENSIDCMIESIWVVPDHGSELWFRVTCSVPNARKTLGQVQR